MAAERQRDSVTENSVQGDVQKFVGWGLGGVVGAGLTFAIYTFGWVFLGGPAQEFFEEKVLDPRRGKADGESDENDAEPAIEENDSPSGYRILVSDLHIDGWREYSPQRVDAFLDFLKCVHQTPQVTEIYLNGDLLDLPLHPIHQGRDEPLTLDIEEELKKSLCLSRAYKKQSDMEAEEKWQGVLPTHLDTIFAALRDVTGNDREPPLHAYYFTGNHDIGISGLRYFRPDLPGLPAHAIWNPSGLILGPRAKAGKKRRAIYLEHGHLHDPLLWLYMRYAVFDLLRGGTQKRERNLLNKFQRGGKRGMAASAAEASDQAQLLSDGAPARVVTLATIRETLGQWAENIVRYRYRHAARRAHRRLSTRRPDLDISTVVFGHTHLPESHEFPAGWKYINAGSWDGKKSDQTYWVIRPDGSVSERHEWQQGGTLNLD